MGEPESIRAQWVVAAAAGKSFAEVGGLWGTVNEQVTVAAHAGATSTTMIDVEPSDDDLWRLFHDRAASLGVTVDAVSSEWGGRATLYRARSVRPAPAPAA